MKTLLTTSALLLAMTLVSPKSFAQATTTTKEVETTQPAQTTESAESTQTTETTETKTSDNKGGLFIEPAVTYETGTGAMDFGAAGKPDGDLKGLGAGLRFGGHVSDIFFLALDANYSEPEFTDENGNFDYDLKSWTAGVTVGLQTPVVGLRVWGGYIPFGEIELDGRGSNQSNVTYKDPDMWKLGAGFRVGIISLNLEYLTGTYEKLNIRNAGPITGTYSQKADRDSWIASVSFPLAL